jgi:hypothetical protein
MKHICNQDCIYYPRNYSLLIKEYTTKNGVKKRKAVYLCDYDDHRITKFEKCEYYKTLKDVSK